MWRAVYRPDRNKNALVHVYEKDGRVSDSLCGGVSALTETLETTDLPTTCRCCARIEEGRR
jgi:hypothetical protein